MADTKAGKYIEAVGRRKTATARVRLTKSKKGSFVVNEKSVNEYFPTDELYKIVYDPFTKTKTDPDYSVSVHVKGGGIHAQAEAVRHGISRVLVKINEDELRSPLKKFGFLKRDPRMKERRKFGLKKARKAAQWSKR